MRRTSKIYKETFVPLSERCARAAGGLAFLAAGLLAVGCSNRPVTAVAAAQTQFPPSIRSVSPERKIIRATDLIQALSSGSLFASRK